MSVFVVDASLVVKWFIPEVHSDTARKWLDATHDFVAPDLILPEVANAIWKKVRRGELSADEGHDLVADLATVALETVSMRGLISDAYAIAVATGTTVYDASYLTLAARLETEMITGDERFARRLAEHPSLVPHVRFLEDFVS